MNSVLKSGPDAFRLPSWNLGSSFNNPEVSSTLFWVILDKEPSLMQCDYTHTRPRLPQLADGALTREKCMPGHLPLYQSIRRLNKKPSVDLR